MYKIMLVIESVRSQMEQDPSLINRAGNLESVGSLTEHHVGNWKVFQMDQDPSLIHRAGKNLTILLCNQLISGGLEQQKAFNITV